MPIFRLIPAAKDYIWGGTCLKTEYGKTSSTEKIAETWELSCHHDGESIIEQTGKKLSEYLHENPAATGENLKRFSEFPVLIKLIDAARDLSVQVHPNDDYARRFENQLGKTEMWYILSADEGAYLYCGFARDVSKEEFLRAVSENSLCTLLKKVYVKPGDVVFIPSGTIHAICAGIVLCEVQQSSNVTYRVFDYGRVDANGKSRALHVEKACDVVDFSAAKLAPDFGGHLGKCDYFIADKLVCNGKADEFADEKSFVSLVIVSGSGSAESADARLNFSKGDSIFIPASSGKITLSGNFTAIKTTV